MPDETEPRVKVWTPEELPEGPLREGARYDPRRDAITTGGFKGFLDQIARTKKDVDGKQLVCDLCGRRLKIHGRKINGGYFPTGAQARDNGLYTWVCNEESKPEFSRRVGKDVLAMIFYCWRCNTPSKGQKLSRVDRAIRSVKPEWRFEDFATGESDLARAVRRALNAGRIREFGEAPVRGAPS